MKLYSSYDHPDKLFFIIEDIPHVGAYLYVYKEEDFFAEDIQKGSECSGHIEDHHQDDAQMAKEYAVEYFGVPENSWVQAEKEDALA